MKLRRLVSGLAALLLVVVGVGTTPGAAQARQSPKYFVDESTLPFDALPGIATDRHWGVLAGAGYRIEVPQEWNGDLVMWAHGFRGDGLELTVDNHPLRQFLVANGYAWAASSYSRNDYDPGIGMWDTFRLTKRFRGIAGKPDQVYLTGASMGGHLTAAAVERFPRTYDGALALCGVMGDFELFDYFLDYNLAGAALAGVDTSYPPDPQVWLDETVPQITSTLGDPWPAELTADGENLKAMTELRSGGDRPMFDAGFNSWADFLFDLGADDGTVPRSRGIVVDNSDRVYQFDTDPALSPQEQQLNDNIVRVTQDRFARIGFGLESVPVVKGTPRVPVLTLHTLGDLFVPFSMQQIYAERVAARGRSDLVVQRAIRDVGHCSFTSQEFVRGFVDLTAWVEDGVRPAGDDVHTPEVVSDPLYGCQFTTETRNLGPFTAPCP
jgi:pimeloyl-ACP methyl ester carboxylesterase